MKRLVVAVSFVLFASPAFAQKVGDTVVVIAEKRAELQSGRSVVGTVFRGNHLRVDDVNGEWFWVNWMGTKGWVNRSDVIHIDRAIDFFTTAIRRHPTAGDYSSRGTVWWKKGELDIAIGDYNEAIRLDPKDDAAYNNRGTAWYGKGQYDKAISDWNEAIRLVPKWARPYNIRAWLYASCPDGRFRNGRKAVENARKACELTDWKHANNIDTLAAAYAEDGSFSEAVRWQQKAIDLAPANQKADFRSRLSLYQARKPYRTKPK